MMSVYQLLCVIYPDDVVQEGAGTQEGIVTIVSCGDVMQCRLQVRQVFHLLKQLGGNRVSRVIEPVAPPSITFMHKMCCCSLERLRAFSEYIGSSRGM
jgi:hypothetical protein